MVILVIEGNHMGMVLHMCCIYQDASHVSDLGSREFEQMMVVDWVVMKISSHENMGMK